MKKQRMTVVIPGKAPRNPVIAVLKTMKGGAHGPSHKAQRKRDRQNLNCGKHGADEAPFLLVPPAWWPRHRPPLVPRLPLALTFSDGESSYAARRAKRRGTTVLCYIQRPCSVARHRAPALCWPTFAVVPDQGPP